MTTEELFSHVLTSDGQALAASILIPIPIPIPQVKFLTSAEILFVDSKSNSSSAYETVHQFRFRNGIVPSLVLTGVQWVRITEDLELKLNSSITPFQVIAVDDLSKP